jgi:hypothetical protein
MSLPSQTEGAGNTGCTLHPRSREQRAQKTRSRAYRFSGGNPAFPAQWFYAYSVLSPAIRPWVVTVTGGVLTADLTPALRRQDHTYSPYASAPSRLSAHPRPPLPRPALLTLRNAPLSGTGCKSYSAIQVSEKQKYFCKEGWTIRISGANEVEVICPSGSHTGITLPDPIRRRRPCRPPNKNGAARPRRSQ